MKKYNLSAHKTKIIKTIAISILFINITDINAAEYAIIANSSSNISDSYQLIGRAFLKQYTIKNANSDYINPVGNSDVNAQKAFYKYTLDKSLDDVNSYWNSQIFSGGSKPVFKISSGSTGLNSTF